MMINVPVNNIDSFAMQPLDINYDQSLDTLFLFETPQAPGISVDVKGEFYLRVDYLTHRAIGAEIENFQRVFLRKHSDIRPIWREYVRSLPDPPANLVAEFKARLFQILRAYL